MNKDEMIKLYDKKIHIMRTLEELIKPEEMKMVYTHGKKRNAIANAVIQEGNGTITINRIPIQNI